MGAPTFEPNTREQSQVDCWVWGWSGLHSEILSPKTKQKQLSSNSHSAVFLQPRQALLIKIQRLLLGMCHCSGGRGRGISVSSRDSETLPLKQKTMCRGSFEAGWECPGMQWLCRRRVSEYLQQTFPNISELIQTARQLLSLKQDFETPWLSCFWKQAAWVFAIWPQGFP